MRLIPFLAIVAIGCSDAATDSTATALDLNGDYSGTSSGLEAGESFVNQPAVMTIAQDGQALNLGCCSADY